MRLLDLFCGAGGAAMGYFRAGFTDITGVDSVPQPHYPFSFVQADALEYVASHGQEYDAIHASPPCQGYSRLRHLPWLKGKAYPLLLDATREALEHTGVPWVIENVADAPLRNGVILCGTMFGLRVYRHRKFESSVFLWGVQHTPHTHTRTATAPVPARKLPFNGISGTGMVTVAGHFGSVALGSAAMGITWMTAPELTQAIPPAYTTHIGTQLLAVLHTIRTMHHDG